MAILMARIRKLKGMTPTKVIPRLGERDMKQKTFGDGIAAIGSKPVEAKRQPSSVEEIDHELVQKSTPQGSGGDPEAYASVLFW
ncbi:hypothetical protein U1Q18_041556 [Sarracenia purpurea var. burkii]